MLSMPTEKRPNVTQSLVLLKRGKWLLVASVEGEKISSLKESVKRFFPLVSIHKSKSWGTCEITVIYQTLEGSNDHHPSPAQEHVAHSPGPRHYFTSKVWQILLASVTLKLPSVRRLHISDPFFSPTLGPEAFRLCSRGRHQFWQPDQTSPKFGLDFTILPSCNGTWICGLGFQMTYMGRNSTGNIWNCRYALKVTL